MYLLAQPSQLCVMLLCGAKSCPETLIPLPGTKHGNRSRRLALTAVSQEAQGAEAAFSTAAAKVPFFISTSLSHVTLSSDSPPATSVYSLQHICTGTCLSIGSAPFAAVPNKLE